MDFISLKDVQSSLSTGAVIVMDKMLQSIAQFPQVHTSAIPVNLSTQFYKHGLCGQCTLC